MICRTRARVFSEMPDLLLTTAETVCFDTRAARATSSIVSFERRGMVVMVLFRSVFSARASGAPFRQKARDLVRSRTDRFSELHSRQCSRRKFSILPRRDRPRLGANPLC